MAGIVLLVIGIIDIGAMAYCITNNITYSSSFNIFAVIAGIFLMRGSVKAARIVRWISVFFIVGAIGVLVLMPLSMPLQLLITQAKLDPFGTFASHAMSIIFICVLIWLYMQLSTQGALKSFEQASYGTGQPKSAFIAAVGLLVVVQVLLGMMFNSDSAEKAKTLAREQLGPGYEYHINSISTSGGNGAATVTAYNSDEIKNIQVRW